MLGDGIGLRNLEQALARYIEIGVESGVATGGSNTTLADTTKNWEVNRWVGGDIHIVIAGIEYVRTISANTATAITFAALPGVIAPVAGDPYSVRRIEVDIAVAQLTPLEKANEHNTAELAATDILAAALVPTNTPCLFRVMVAFDTAGVFSATITQGGNTQTVEFDLGGNLIADSLYMFDHFVGVGDTINYRYSVNAQLLVLRVQEIVAGVQ